MKRHLLLILLISFLAHRVHAQTGIMVQGLLGITGKTDGPLSMALNRPEIFDNGYPSRSACPTFGLGITALQRHLLLGAETGFAWQPRRSFDNGAIEYRLGGGYLNIGYQGNVHRNHAWYGLFGLGILHARISLWNGRPDSIHINATHHLRPGEKGNYDAWAPCFQVVGGYRHVPGQRYGSGRTGFLWSLEAGYRVAGDRPWRYRGNDEVIPELDRSPFGNFFLRLGLGLGRVG